MKTSYNKSEIMKRAWVLFLLQSVRTMEMWSYCMKQSWGIAKGTVKVEKEMTFEQIYNKYYSEVLQFINYKMNYKHKEVAEEICNDTFLKGVPTFDKSHGSKITTWLKGIAYRLILDSYKKDTSVTIDEVADEYGYSVEVKQRINKTNHIGDYVNEDGDEWLEFDSQSDTSAELENSELLNSVNKGFSNLKPKYQQIANLRFVEQYSYNEIAQLLNISENTVKQQILRAKEMLKAELKSVGASYSLR